jgi:hypothetical protein
MMASMADRAPEFLLDLALDIAQFPGTIDLVRLRRIVADIALVHINALDFPAGQGLGPLDHLFQGVAVIRVSVQRFGVQDEPSVLSPLVGRCKRDLDAELVRRSGLAFADTLGLRGVPGIELPTSLALLLAADLR